MDLEVDVRPGDALRVVLLLHRLEHVLSIFVSLCVCMCVSCTTVRVRLYLVVMGCVQRENARRCIGRNPKQAMEASARTHARTHHGELLLEALVGVVDQQLLERIALFWFVVGGGG